MKIRLYHGRKHPDEELNDWGFEGAILEGVTGLIWTYGVPRVYFENDEFFKKAQELTGWEAMADALEMRVYEDMIQSNEGYFGDWELI